MWQGHFRGLRIHRRQSKQCLKPRSILGLKSGFVDITTTRPAAPLAFFLTLLRETIFEELYRYLLSMPCCIGKNSTFIRLCHLFHRSVFCFFLLEWLHFLFFLLYRPECWTPGSKRQFSTFLHLLCLLGSSWKRRERPALLHPVASLFHVTQELQARFCSQSWVRGVKCDLSFSFTLSILIGNLHLLCSGRNQLAQLDSAIEWPRKLSVFVFSQIIKWALGGVPC